MIRDPGSIGSLRQDPALAAAITLSPLRTLPPATLDHGEANFARLRQLKARFDPTNVFRYNQNIALSAPVGAGS